MFADDRNRTATEKEYLFDTAKSICYTSTTNFPLKNRSKIEIYKK